MNRNATEERISVTVLLDLKGADRAAKAYAFLYTAFRKTEVSQNPVRDALDCITPFIAPYLNTIAGKQIDIVAVQSFLKTTVGFDIPLYALEQVVPSLAKGGLAEYNSTTKRYLAKKTDASFDLAKSEIETDFDQVEQQLRQFAKSLGLDAPPASSTWGDALISFLKSRTEGSTVSVAKIKGALLDPSHVENSVVGFFIRNVHDHNYPMFDKLLRIFMGVLVEDFMSSVAEIGNFGKGQPLNIFYDTAVLLRVMGCSGKLLRAATEELTRYLQDLGCRIFYLAGNEAEVANILNTIIYVKDTGGELEGETAEAVSNGEVSITELRMLENSFPERLARLNIFPAEEFERDISPLAQYQIDERAFSEFLLQQANASKRPYGIQNRTNDAGFLGTVMRLRKHIRTRDLSECRFLFITTNRFLAATARHFLLKTKALQPQHCPPMLSVGQVATIAWLMKDQVLAPEKAGRELLAHCFAAIRPDATWFGYFREGMERVVGPIDAYTRDAANSLALQAARRIAQEESFGSASLVRELNMAEILSRAKEQTDEMLAESKRKEEEAQQTLKREAALAMEQVSNAAQSAIDQAKTEAKSAIELAAAEARTALANEIVRANQRKAYRLANWTIIGLKLLSAVVFAVITALDFIFKEHAATWLRVVQLILALIAFVSFLDLMEVPLVKRSFEKLESWLAKLYFKILHVAPNEK
jgi:hypothetical protein